MAAPVTEMLEQYRRQCRIRMHMPGHKGKFPGTALDVTETAGTDNLNAPAGAIKRAQELLAQACGAERSFFLAGGSSLGLQAAILYACYEKKLLLPRSAHRMAVQALALAGGEAVFLPCAYDEEAQLYAQPDAETVERALEEDGQIAAVLITRPDYYGACCDLGRIAETVHRHGRLLIVDEAHGAHFPYSDLLPASAGALGADIWIQSAHKTLPALTQGAYLHCNAGVDGDRLADRIRLIQTTSPSFLLVQSLDDVRDFMSQKGEMAYRRLYELLAKLPRRLANGIERADFASLGSVGQDFTRVVFDCRSSGYTGCEVERYLQAKGIYPEMSDLYRVVCITTIADDEADLEELWAVLAALPPKERAAQPIPAPPPLKRVMGIRAAALGKRKKIPLQAAAGEVSACVLGAYPPGGNLVIPGEALTEEMVGYIRYLLDAGLTVMGIEDGCVPVVD